MAAILERTRSELIERSATEVPTRGPERKDSGTPLRIIRTVSVPPRGAPDTNSD